MHHIGYIVYCCFETKHPVTGSPVNGSLLLDRVATEEEAQKMVEMYNSKTQALDKLYGEYGTRKYMYIRDNTNFWT